MDVQPELLADYACVTGEGPLWHPLEKRLYWVDISLGRLFRYDPATGASEQIYEGEPIGGYTVQADGALLLFMTRGAIRIWRDGRLTTVVEEIPAERDSRFNDVIADPAGRVFCGTMPTGAIPGRLYRLDRDGSLTVVLDDALCSNGMGFTGDRRTMYYTDSYRQQISAFDYDEASGALTNRRLFVEVPASLGLPDGMTVDADDHVWSANWGGACLLRFDPRGAEVARIDFSALKKVSSATFGGDDGTDLYVTTAGGNEKQTDGAQAGALFRLRVPGVSGRQEFFSRVLL